MSRSARAARPVPDAITVYRIAANGKAGILDDDLDSAMATARKLVEAGKAVIVERDQMDRADFLALEDV